MDEQTKTEATKNLMVLAEVEMAEAILDRCNRRLEIADEIEDPAEKLVHLSVSRVLNATAKEMAERVAARLKVERQETAEETLAEVINLIDGNRRRTRL